MLILSVTILIRCYHPSILQDQLRCSFIINCSRNRADPFGLQKLLHVPQKRHRCAFGTNPGSTLTRVPVGNSSNIKYLPRMNHYKIEIIINNHYLRNLWLCLVDLSLINPGLTFIIPPCTSWENAAMAMGRLKFSTTFLWRFLMVSPKSWPIAQWWFP